MSPVSVVLAALGIGLLIALHEFGHFLAARLAGCRVDVFSLGFGPRIWGFQWRETDFRIAAIPLGGYVIVAGQDPADRSRPAKMSLWSKSVAQRALFWSGGVLMNLAFALVAFPIAFWSGVEFTAPVVGSVESGGAAWTAGLAPGDRITAVGGKEAYSYEVCIVEAALHGGRPLELRVRGRDGAQRTVAATPQWHEAQGRFDLGFLPGPSPDEAPLLAVRPDGPAARAGIPDGAALLAVGSLPARGDTLLAALAALQATTTQPVSLVVQTPAGERSVEVTPIAAEATPHRIGVMPLARRVRSLRQGLAANDRLGLRSGDVLVAIAGRAFAGDDLTDAFRGDGELVVVVRRDGAEVRLAAPLAADARQSLAAGIALDADDPLVMLPMVGSPAAAAGLLAGDRVEQVDGKPCAAFEEVRDLVVASAGRPLQLDITRLMPGAAAERRTLVVAAVREPVFDLGVVPTVRNEIAMLQSASVGDALVRGLAMSADLVKQIYATLKRMATGDVGTKNLGGIIRISQVSYRAAERGPTWLLYLLAMLSLNLAIVNLLPIPVLDGGHLMFLLIERIKGSPVSARVFGYSQYAGLVFLLFLVLFVTYNDILQLL